MKKFLSVSTVLVALLITSNAFAWRGCRYGCGHHHPGYGSGFDDGFFAGLLSATYAILLSDTFFHWGDYKELVMLGADQDAAAFLANGEQPTALLQQAMNVERGLAVAAGAKDELSDEQAAYMIIQHAAMMQ